jgi:molecular chaperone DnaK
MAKIIGIDLGTTNSCVAIMEGGKPKVIENSEGARTTPSIVAYAENDEILVGAPAKRQAVTNAKNTLYAVKRLIGRRFEEKEVQKDIGLMPYRISKADNGDAWVEVRGKGIAPPQVSAEVLRKMKKTAEDYLGETVTEAVITVPAYFNDGQRQGTKDAGRIAGLEVVRIINEPTSAALAYGFGKQMEKKVAVIDLGGGTFDVSILDVGKSVYDVIAVGGDTYLGGEDFDRRVIDWLVFSFAQEHQGIDLRQDKMAMQRLRDAAERAKIELSETSQAAIHLPFLASGSDGKAAVHLDRQLTREKLEELTRDLVDKTIQVADRTLRDAGVRVGQIGEVLLVGGMTRMPRVQQAVRQHFGREPSRGVHPEEVVALGAAIQAHALLHPQKGKEVLLLDVTPQNLGILVVGGYFSTVIPRNTTVPTSQSHLFTTVQDNQTSVRIAVLQGASDKAVENELLGEFVLDGIRSARRGEVEIEVNFDISADGIVGVSARDSATGARQSITVTATSGLTENEMRRILEENMDEMLTRRQVGDLERLRDRTRAVIAEIDGLSPRVKEALAKSRFGKDAVVKAEDVVGRAKAAIEARDLQQLIAVEEPLDRALQLFKGLAGGAAPGQKDPT